MEIFDLKWLKLYTDWNLCFYLNYVLMLMNVILSMDTDFMIFNGCFMFLLNCYAECTD